MIWNDHDLIPDAPVRMIEIGPGLCRGPGWQDGKWPLDKGSMSAQECANACAKKKGCTAFDLSSKSSAVSGAGSAAGKFACFLYGHKDVEPANALKGHCYTFKGNLHTEQLANEEVLDEIEDQEDEANQSKSFSLHIKSS